MFRRLIILLSLIAFSPVAAGAQELAALVSSPPPPAGAAAPVSTSGPDLSIPEQKAVPRVVAANDLQGTPVTEAPAKKSHPGLTFKEFCEVHFGEYRWVYWVGAAGALVLFHVFAVDHH
jgi:hypothetical protein